MRQNWHIPFFIIKNISPMNLSLSPAGSAANPAVLHLYIGGRQLTIADRRPLNPTYGTVVSLLVLSTYAHARQYKSPYLLYCIQVLHSPYLYLSYGQET